jgi:catechol 2,3-dioxygenase-like lactoylglutathione lyase family enzyme
MAFSVGINHLALLTHDVDAFTDFYVAMFDAEVLFDFDEDGLRHAAVDVGGGAALHAFAVPDNPQAAASNEMFNRGHIDHLAINVEDEDALNEARRRLVEREVSDGVVTDFGVLKSVSFRDPDGMEAEVALWGTQPPRRWDERIRSTASGVGTTQT